MPPVRVGIIGLGGFAGAHHQAVARLEEQGHARLVCTCDPQAPAFAAVQEKLRFGPRGVAVFTDYRAMLKACQGSLDLVVVPTPINLHAERHAAVTALGLPVYLEKPPTLDYEELERMILADQRARKKSLVGFNFIVEKQRLALKGRLLAGEFGAVKSATLLGLWPRPASYFSRNDWAGRIFKDGRIVLDSCLGNALAHFVHNILFWAGGPERLSWGQLAIVRAELYRAHAIEGADTFFVEAVTTSGARLRFGLSHACAGESTHQETVACEKAVIAYAVGGKVEVRWNDGRVESAANEPFDGLIVNHLDYYRYLRGETPRPATTLEDSRPFVTLNDLVHISSGQITPVPPALINRTRDEKDQNDYVAITGIAEMMAKFLKRGEWPKLVGANREPGTEVTPPDLPKLQGVLRGMAGPTAKTLT